MTLWSSLQTLWSNQSIYKENSYRISNLSVHWNIFSDFRTEMILLLCNIRWFYPCTYWHFGWLCLSNHKNFCCFSCEENHEFYCILLQRLYPHFASLYLTKNATFQSKRGLIWIFSASLVCIQLEKLSFCGQFILVGCRYDRLR